MRRDHLRNEAAFVPRSVNDLAVVRRELLAAGHRPPVVSGIVGWLVSKAAGDPDTTSAPTRSQYRKILAELDVAHRPANGRPMQLVGAEDGQAVDEADDEDEDPEGDAQNPRFGRSVNYVVAA